MYWTTKAADTGPHSCHRVAWLVTMAFKTPVTSIDLIECLKADKLIKLTEFGKRSSR